MNLTWPGCRCHAPYLWAHRAEHRPLLLVFYIIAMELLSFEAAPRFRASTGTCWFGQKFSAIFFSAGGVFSVSTEPSKSAADADADTEAVTEAFEADIFSARPLPKIIDSRQNPPKIVSAKFFQFFVISGNQEVLCWPKFCSKSFSSISIEKLPSLSLLSKQFHQHILSSQSRRQWFMKWQQELLLKETLEWGLFKKPWKSRRRSISSSLPVPRIELRPPAKMEPDLPRFRPFTREELEIIEGRIFDKKLQEKKKAEKRAKNVAVRDFFPH